MASANEDRSLYADALPLYERVLAIRRKSAGEADPEVARVLHTIALLKYHLRQ